MVTTNCSVSKHILLSEVELIYVTFSYNESVIRAGSGGGGGGGGHLKKQFENGAKF